MLAIRHQPQHECRGPDYLQYERVSIACSTACNAELVTGAWQPHGLTQAETVGKNGGGPSRYPREKSKEGGRDSTEGRMQTASG